MSFSFGWCRRFFAFLRRFHLRGANASSLSYVVFVYVVPILLFLMSFSPVWCRHLFTFLRRFHLCSADSSSLSYVISTYVIFLCHFHLGGADNSSLSYAVFTCMVPTLLRFLTSFSPMWCRYFSFLCRFRLCGADICSLSYVVSICVAPTKKWAHPWREMCFCFVFCFVLFGCRTISFLENVYLSSLRNLNDSFWYWYS